MRSKFRPNSPWLMLPAAVIAAGIAIQASIPTELRVAGVLVLLLSLISAAGIWATASWARWLGAGVCSLLLFFVLYFGFSQGWSPACLAMLALILYVNWDMLRAWLMSGSSTTSDSDPNSEERPMVSIVALVRELPFLDADILARHIEKAWHRTLTTGDQDAADFVVGEEPVFAINLDSQMYLVHYHNQPYFDDPEQAADAAHELRTRQAIEQHQAWYSVDYMLPSDDESDRADEYARIGKLMAQIVDDDCLALLLPGYQAFFPWEPEFLAALNSDQLLDRLKLGNPPVIQVANDDPRMQSAVQEARECFSEFEQAFQQSVDDQQTYSVKAPITVGENTEYIWLTVTAIENGVIYGQLGNDPVNLGNLRCNDRVRVNVDSLNDWLYTTDDGYEGGFTVKVLAEIARQNAEADDAD